MELAFANCWHRFLRFSSLVVLLFIVGICILVLRPLNAFILFHTSLALVFTFIELHSFFHEVDLAVLIRFFTLFLAAAA